MSSIRGTTQNPIFYIDTWEAMAPGINRHAQWESWVNGQCKMGGEMEYNLASVPKMQRRRLTPMSKIFVTLMERISSYCDPAKVPLIFGSRYGELSIAEKLLNSLSQQEGVSPAQFSHSVHNTVTSLISILYGNHEISRSISAPGDPLAGAITDAGALLMTGKAKQVVVMVGDLQPKSFYQEVCEPLEFSYGLLVLLGTDPKEQGLTWPQFDQRHGSTRPDAFELIRSLFTRQKEFNGNGGRFSLHFKNN